MAEKPDRDTLTASVKQVAKQHGAALVGVAPVERFDPMPPLYDAAPKGHHPKDFLPEARSVISIAQPILNPVMDTPGVLATREIEMIPEHVKYPYFETLYNRVGHVVHDCMLEFIGQMVGQHLLAHGYQTMIFPTTGLHPRVDGLSETQIWEGPPSELLVMAISAVVCIIIAHTALYAALREVKAVVSTTLMQLTPVVTIACSAVVYGDRLSPMQMLGGAAVLTGAWLAAMAQARLARKSRDIPGPELAQG